MNNREFLEKEFNSNRNVWRQADGSGMKDNNPDINQYVGMDKSSINYGGGNGGEFRGRILDGYKESGNFWEGGWGENWRADGDGNEMPTQLHSSAPYIIQIVNNCSSAISNVDVGDSYVNRISSNSSYNFGQNPFISITSTISGVSYLEFLAQSESQPFTVGKTMIISTSAGQLDQTVAITHRNASGDRVDHVVTPTLDPYQSQTDRVIDEYEYLFDGMTRARFNQINGNATVTIRFYIKNKFAASQIIAGRPAEQVYEAPNLIKIGGALV